jgi:hypothetical protein
MDNDIELIKLHMYRFFYYSSIVSVSILSILGFLHLTGDICHTITPRIEIHINPDGSRDTMYIYKEVK